MKEFEKITKKIIQDWIDNVAIPFLIANPDKEIVINPIDSKQPLFVPRKKDET